jgi:hypothetical protein
MPKKAIIIDIPPQDLYVCLRKLFPGGYFVPSL